MLQAIRERAQGVIVGVIVLFIIITFAFWGVQEYLQAASDVTVAEVNDTEITLSEFQSEFRHYRRQMQAMLGEDFDISQMDPARLKHMALEQIVNEELLQQFAHGSKMRVSDAQVAAAIQSIDTFQRDGQFSNSLYEQRLQMVGMSPVGFEEQMRRDMITEQIQRGIVDSAFVTDDQVAEFRRLQAQTRDIRYAFISTDPYRDEVEVTDEEIRQYYEEHSDQFMIPEQVRVAYIDLSTDALADQVEVDEALLRDYYERNEANWRVEQERSASHILVRVEDGASEEEIEAARQEALEYRELALSGESFEEIAREHSDDAGSRAEGGETGFFKRGVMAPAFDEAVFSMEPGEISEPIRTDFGFHVIRLNEIKPGGTPAFEQIRDKVVEAYRRKQAEKFYYEQAERLANLTFEHPDTLEVAAEELGLPVKQSGMFDRSGGDGVLGRPEVIEAAFSTEVVLDGLNSEPIELSDGRMVVLRNLEHQSAERKPLETVRGEIVEALTEQKARDRAFARGRELLERLRGGEDPASVAEAGGLQWRVADGVDRQSPDVARAVVRQAFRLPRPQDGAVYGGVPMGTGRFALVELRAVRDNVPEEPDPEQRASLRRQIAEIAGTRQWREFVTSLESAARVRLYEDKL